MFWALWQPPKLCVVSQTTIQLLGEQGRAGAHSKSGNRLQRTFRQPDTRTLLFPSFHMDNCRDILRECRGRAPKSCGTSGITQRLHCLGCPCSSASPPGCYFYITFLVRIFFVWSSCSHEETSQKKPPVPQCAPAVLGVCLTGIKRHRWGRGSALGQRRV